MIMNLLSGDPSMVGPYRLLARLGQGGMGVVYLARSPGGRQVAVKVIRPELAGEPGFRTRFAREVAAARNVSGMFTALVVDADTLSPLPWLATAYVPGQSLAEAVETEGLLPTQTVLQLAAGLAEGLQAIHSAGVVHRDLKPSNVLLAPDGPRVIDFGISKATETSMLTQTGTVMGTPGYLSPEQAEGGAITFASDVFSLGGVLTYAATGAPPFGAGPSAALLYRVVNRNPDLSAVPDVLRPLIERCMAKDPAARPSPADLLADLDALGAGVGVVTPEWLPESVTAANSRYVPTVQTPATPPDEAGEHDPTSIAPPTRSEAAPDEPIGTDTETMGIEAAAAAVAGGELAESAEEASAPEPAADVVPLTPVSVEVSAAIDEAPSPPTPADATPAVAGVSLAAVADAASPALAVASAAEAATVAPALAGSVLDDSAPADAVTAAPAAPAGGTPATPAAGGPGGPGGGTPSPAPRPGQRRRMLLAAAAAVIILAGVGSYVGLDGGHPGKQLGGGTAAVDVTASSTAGGTSANPSKSPRPSPSRTPTHHPKPKPKPKPTKHPHKVTPAATALASATQPGYTPSTGPTTPVAVPTTPTPTPTPKPKPKPTPTPAVAQSISSYSGASEYACGPIASNPGSSSSITFTNDSSAGITVEEYSSSGGEESGGSIGSGQSDSFGTHIGSIWDVFGTGGCLGGFDVYGTASVTVS
jgi:serine/threonine protein kinase